MPKSTSDTAPVALTPLRPEQVRNAVRQALFDAATDGRVGSPQERLEAKSRKAANDAIMLRAKKLFGIDPNLWSRWYQRLVAGEDPAVILNDMGG